MIDYTSTIIILNIMLKFVPYKHVLLVDSGLGGGGGGVVERARASAYGYLSHFFQDFVDALFNWWIDIYYFMCSLICTDQIQTVQTKLRKSL